MDTKTDRAEFAELIGGLAIAFSKPADKLLLRAYWMGLQDLDIERVKVGVANALRSCRFMPTVAEIRERSGELSYETRAELAWAIVRREITRHDYYESIDFDDPAINATIRAMGGWMAICDRDRDPKESDTWIPQNFKKTYQSFARVGVTAEMGAPLIGFCEKQNKGHGHDEHSPPMVHIACGLTPVKRIGSSVLSADPKIELRIGLIE